MHLLDVERGFYGGWGIVAGQLPIATGLALALTRRGRADAVLCELGDGAVNMGAWHESLNLAALWDLPVVFLVVNNVYGMGTSVDRASAEPDLFKRAASYRMARRAGRRRRPRGGHRGHRPPAQRRPRGAQAGRAGGDDLPLSRPLGRRRRARLPQPRRRSTSVATATRSRGCGRSWPSAGSRRPSWRPPSSAPTQAIEAAVAFADADAEPALDRLAAGMYAPTSELQFERMQPGRPFGEQELVFAAGLGA